MFKENYIIQIEEKGVIKMKEMLKSRTMQLFIVILILATLFLPY